MKKLLIMLVLICSKGFGQTTGSSTGILNIPPYIRQDTIRVIMLCADTAYVLTYNSGTGIVSFPYKNTFWQYGYEVNDVWTDHSKRLKYLDADKQELSKNIIVWDSKQIK